MVAGDRFHFPTVHPAACILQINLKLSFSRGLS
jgi:hypothetical protein